MKRKKLVLFGTGKLTDVLFHYLTKFDLAEVVAFTVDKSYVSTSSHQELPVVAFEELDEKFAPAFHELLIPLTPNKQNKLREEKFKEAKQKGYGLSNFIHPSVLNECTLIGENNIIFENVVLQPCSTIGDNNVIWSGSYVGHHVVIGNHNWISAGTVIGGESRINNNCFVGINCAVRNNVVIENETFIGMGLSVNRCTKPKEVFAGTSAVAHKLTSDRLSRIV